MGLIQVPAERNLIHVLHGYGSSGPAWPSQSVREGFPYQTTWFHRWFSAQIVGLARGIYTVVQAPQQSITVLVMVWRRVMIPKPRPRSDAVPSASEGIELVEKAGTAGVVALAAEPRQERGAVGRGDAGLRQWQRGGTQEGNYGRLDGSEASFLPSVQQGMVRRSPTKRTEGRFARRHEHLHLRQRLGLSNRRDLAERVDELLDQIVIRSMGRLSLMGIRAASVRRIRERCQNSRPGETESPAAANAPCSGSH